MRLLCVGNGSLAPERFSSDFTHWGYGVDDPLDQDLAPGQVSYNDTIFSNLLWDVTQSFQIARAIFLADFDARKVERRITLSDDRWDRKTRPIEAGL